MTESFDAKLVQFVIDKCFHGKGPLCVALVVTQHARTMGLPLDPEKLITDGGGQVLGLGKGAVQTILSRHGISRVLASEGGRIFDDAEISRPDRVGIRSLKTDLGIRPIYHRLEKRVDAHILVGESGAR